MFSFDIMEAFQLSSQDPGSYLSFIIIQFHNYIMCILIIILITVSWIMFQSFIGPIYVKNLTDHSELELIWTIVPAIVLLFIAFPSLHLLYQLDDVIEPSLTLKAIGNQWYWSYEYSDFEELEVEYQSYLITSQDLNEGDLRLREVDNRVIVPINANIKVLVSSNDVIHAWAIPSLGVKIDAMPGRLNQTSLLTNRPGLFAGGCSEICGSEHSYMPIMIESVSVDLYAKWILSFSNKGFFY